MEEETVQKQKEETVERLQTRIDMIRMESRSLSHKVEIMLERRKELSETKKRLKELLAKIETLA
jgi:archaellum component FlaC|tara:strand:+ start:147 stop:338 length:192 start_codon:yes stop_codon:yes gene_type:complete